MYWPWLYILLTFIVVFLLTFKIYFFHIPDLSLCLLDVLKCLLQMCCLTLPHPDCFGPRIYFNTVLNVSIVLLKHLSNIHFPSCFLKPKIRDVSLRPEFEKVNLTLKETVPCRIGQAVGLLLFQREEGGLQSGTVCG